VKAYEVDGLALEGLRRSAEERGLTERIEIHEGNFQVDRKQKPDFAGIDLMLVDPPRSGLMKFLDPLEAMPLAERPTHFVYVSCFAESFTADTARLLAMGYRPTQLAIVDQFPQSRHYEIVASFRLG
jgi:23S rRNA (uracil1939-C5)-methyltransferase